MGYGYMDMADVESSGTPGTDNLTDDTIDNSTVNNTSRGYIVLAWPVNGSWSSNLLIGGVSIEYEE